MNRLWALYQMTGILEQSTSAANQTNSCGAAGSSRGLARVAALAHQVSYKNGPLRARDDMARDAYIYLTSNKPVLTVLIRLTDRSKVRTHLHQDLACVFLT